MNPQDSRGRGVKPGPIEMGYSKDTNSTILRARLTRPVMAEGKGGLLYMVSKLEECELQNRPKAMLAMTCRHCNLTISSSPRGLEAKLWSCDFPSCLVPFLLNVKRMMGSKTPNVTTSSFCGGWPTISFFRALKTSICSAVLLEFRICATQGSRAILEKLWMGRVHLKAGSGRSEARRRDRWRDIVLSNPSEELKPIMIHRGGSPTRVNVESTRQIWESLLHDCCHRGKRLRVDQATRLQIALAASEKMPVVSLAGTRRTSNHVSVALVASTSLNTPIGPPTRYCR
jgi:hypothetical protein